MPETIPLGGSDASPLFGDLYRPDGKGPHPILVGVPGGGWLRGARSGLHHWGVHFATAGIAFLSIDYRRSVHGAVYPGNAEDVAAALRLVAATANETNLDPSRLGLLGASAGAHLAALVALSDRFATPPLKALIGVYGVYDLVSHWHESKDPGAADENLAERMMGCTPEDNQERYLDASPVRHVTQARNRLPTLLVWGDADQVVLPAQSESFAVALRQAQFPLRTQVVPGAGHFWFSEQPLTEPNGHTARVAPLLTRFAHQHLRAKPRSSRARP